MVGNVRQKKLIDLLVASQAMTVADLSEKLNTSMMTIRRDLEFLEQQGIIRKLHGGAVLMKQETVQPSFEERITESGTEKENIGKAAARLVRSGSIIFFDAGTTTLAAAQNIPDDLEFTAITTGLITAIALCKKPKANIINIGGYIHNTSYSSINSMSIEMIQRFNADMAFISTKAISFPEGTFEAHLQLIEVKQAMVSASKEVILLADHRKFETKSLSLSIPFNQINTLITDTQTHDGILEKIKGMGILVIRA